MAPAIEAAFRRVSVKNLLRMTSRILILSDSGTGLPATDEMD